MASCMVEQAGGRGAVRALDHLAVQAVRAFVDGGAGQVVGLVPSRRPVRRSPSGSRRGPDAGRGEVLTHRLSDSPIQPIEASQQPAFHRRDAPGRHERYIDVPSAPGPCVRVVIRGDRVTTTGTGYLSTPGISARTTLLGVDGGRS